MNRILFAIISIIIIPTATLPACSQSNEYINFCDLLRRHDINEDRLALLAEGIINSRLTNGRPALRLNCLNANNENLIMIAIAHQKPKIAELLLRQRNQQHQRIIPINQVSILGDNTLSYAINKKLWTIAETLIQQNIVLTALNINQILALNDLNIKRTLIRLIIQRDNPFLMPEPQGDIFYDILKYAYQQYQAGNFWLLANIFGFVEYNTIPKTVSKKAELYFNPHYLQLILFDLKICTQNIFYIKKKNYSAGRGITLGLEKILKSTELSLNNFTNIRLII